MLSNTRVSALEKPLQYSLTSDSKDYINSWTKSTDKYHSTQNKHSIPQTLKEDGPGLNNLIYLVRL